MLRWSDAGLWRACARVLMAWLCLCMLAVPGGALEIVRISPNIDAIDLLPALETYKSEDDRLTVQTAPGVDGIVRRIEVQASEAGERPNWIVFALKNDSDDTIEKLLVAPRFRLIDSGLIWPDLGSPRIVAVTASMGARPEREDGGDSDVFQLTLEPGATVTFIAELRTPRLPQLSLWDPEAYKDKVNSLTLYRGIVVGIAALLAMFLTVVVAVRGSIIFPAAAALAWAVLVYLGIDFGLFAKFLAVRPEAERLYRAGAETVLAGTLVVFLFAYLNLNRWHVRYSVLTSIWILFLMALLALAIFNAPVAAGVARISIGVVALVGFILIVYLSFHGYDRAVMLVPTWFLLLVWCAAVGLVIGGQLRSEFAPPALLGGLVLIVMLIGFTVMQNAFSIGIIARGAVTDAERKALALTGANDYIFDWDVLEDHIFVSPEFEQHLALTRGTLDGPAAAWVDIIHPTDRDRYRATLEAVLEQRRGRINQDFRLRSQDGHSVWYRLKARPVVDNNGEVVRVVGTLTDVTEARMSEERLLRDAVHDNLTGLPNRKLFLERLDAALIFSRADTNLRPTVIGLDLDRFKQVNDSLGPTAADTILLTIARRLSRLMKPADLIGRLAGDSFGVILVSEQDRERILALADLMRRAISAVMIYDGREIIVTATLGVVFPDAAQNSDRDALLKCAELAVTHGKRSGGDRVEVFRAAMQSDRVDRLAVGTELRRALERNELRVLFQPIVRLDDRTIAGFEALVRWDHPRLGRLSPVDFIPVAEETGLIHDLGLFVMERTARELNLWQQALVVEPPIFASVNISSRQLLRHDLLQDVKGIFLRHPVLRGSLKLELTESLIMENPEYAAQMMLRLREIGAGLALDDFGTGYSSLAYLQRFTFDTLKIDQSFVRHTGSGSRPVILRSIIALAHDLKMQVVAEGAETEADTVELSQLGCEYAQGFAFGQPMTVEQARRLIGVSTSEPL
ncbi:MAG TPA: EAL domain-containing protein [Beijerinckiaceae bacterium]|nr:EAL domain-containing protein [Beijerinckiaceae bacterium]